MNAGIIFAGGTGKRMKSNSTKPKQFLEIHGKPIIVHTLQVFQEHPEIDFIVIACIKGWITYLEELVKKYNINKVKSIVNGGDTGLQSIYNALEEAEKISGNCRTVALIHDGVRPLIKSSTISDNIASVNKYGSAITTVPVKETIMVVSDDKSIDYIPNREHSRLARAPQSFWLDEVLMVYRKAISDGIYNFIDTCSMMQYYKKKMYLVDGPQENIKITTPDDFYMMRAFLDARENAQVYGYDTE